jgi:hypothetical protein
MDEQTVRRDVLVAFEYSYKHDDWVYPWRTLWRALRRRKQRGDRAPT